MLSITKGQTDTGINVTWSFYANVPLSCTIDSHYNPFTFRGEVEIMRYLRSH